MRQAIKAGVLVMMLLIVASCDQNKNSNEEEARFRLKRCLEGGNRNHTWARCGQVAYNLRELGWIGQNEKPDSIFFEDSQGKGCLDISRNGWGLSHIGEYLGEGIGGEVQMGGVMSDSLLREVRDSIEAREE